MTKIEIYADTIISRIDAYVNYAQTHIGHWPVKYEWGRKMVEREQSRFYGVADYARTFEDVSSEDIRKATIKVERAARRAISEIFELESPRKLTWDDIYERADGAAYRDPELTAKDEARYQVGQYILETENRDIEDTNVYESAEEEIDFYVSEHPTYFDKYGNLLEVDGKRLG